MAKKKSAKKELDLIDKESLEYKKKKAEVISKVLDESDIRFHFHRPEDRLAFQNYFEKSSYGDLNSSTYSRVLENTEIGKNLRDKLNTIELLGDEFNRLGAFGTGDVVARDILERSELVTLMDWREYAEKGSVAHEGYLRDQAAKAGSVPPVTPEAPSVSPNTTTQASQASGSVVDDAAEMAPSSPPPPVSTPGPAANVVEEAAQAAPGPSPGPAPGPSPGPSPASSTTNTPEGKMELKGPITLLREEEARKDPRYISGAIRGDESSLRKIITGEDLGVRNLNFSGPLVRSNSSKASEVAEAAPGPAPGPSPGPAPGPSPASSTTNTPGKTARSLSQILSEGKVGRNALAGAAAGAVLGGLNPAGDDGLFKGAMGGGIVGATMGGLAGAANAYLNEEGSSLISKGGRLMPNPVTGDSVKSGKVGALLSVGGIAGGLLGGLIGGSGKGKRHNTIDSNGWSRGTHPAYF